MRKRKQCQFNILAIASNPSTLNTIEYVLTRTGYQVLTCSGASDAVGFIKGKDIDIIIADPKIHNDSGHDLFEYVRANFKVAVIILVEGYFSFEEAAKALKLVADECLVRPFANKYLIVSVRRAIGTLVRLRSSFR